MFNKKSIRITNTLYFRGYGVLTKKLKTILAENENPLLFSPCKRINENHAQLGILVSGKTSDGISEFNKFFSVNDIDFHFYELNKRMGGR